jgi:hypothetical protein
VNISAARGANSPIASLSHPPSSRFDVLASGELARPAMASPAASSKGSVAAVFSPPQQIERSVDRRPVEVASGIRNGRNSVAGQAQKDRLGNVLGIGHAACDAAGRKQNAPMMLGKHLREDLAAFR